MYTCISSNTYNMIFNCHRGLKMFDDFNTSIYFYYFNKILKYLLLVSLKLFEINIENVLLQFIVFSANHTANRIAMIPI